jgi:hypothetical protein
LCYIDKKTTTFIMGNQMPSGMGDPNQNNANNQKGGKDGEGDKKKKKRFEPRPTASASSRNARRRKRKGPSGLNKTPTIVPTSKCKLRLLKLDRVRGTSRRSAYNNAGGVGGDLDYLEFLLRSVTNEDEFL